MKFMKTIALGAFLATTLASGSAFSKAHDQGLGNADTFGTPPGVNVHNETVSNTPSRAGGKSNGNARMFDGHPGKGMGKGKGMGMDGKEKHKGGKNFY